MIVTGEFIMAIIPCRECTHHVSDLAMSCPSCGAPIAQTVKAKPRRKRMLPRVLLTLMILWTLGTLLWLLVPQSAFDQLIVSAQSSLQRLDPGIARTLTAERTQTTHPTEEVVHQDAAPADQPAGHQGPAEPEATHRAPAEPQPPTVLPVSTAPAQAQAPRSVYSTTAEQLYRDYEANVVAIETKIGSSRVRLTGNVAEIDQDATGRPVVKIRTGKDSTAAMILADDQRAAAAQLAKGEAIEIECNKLGRNAGFLQGNDCTVVPVDPKPREVNSAREVNLALYLADESGTTRVYVVGPLSEAVCQQRSSEISAKLQGVRHGEQVVFRRCTDAVREKIPTEGCRLNTSSVSLAGLPRAHLWRYDCDSFGAAQASRHKRTPTHSAANVTTLASIAGSAAATDDDHDPEAAHPLPATMADATPAAPAAEHPTTNNIRLASAGNFDTDLGAARIPAEESTVAHPTQTQTQRPVATPNDDLSRVRSTDPRAAEHIASFCAQTNASPERATFVADCRHSEADAWARMVLQNEFPTMDEATRKKCSEPPFPDTYVAKESCARYLLRTK
jgi:hypothetical protein